MLTIRNLGRLGMLALLTTVSSLTTGEPLGAQAVASETQDVVRLALRPESRLWLEGDSNLHAWSCDAEQVVAELTVRRAAGSPTPEGVEVATLTVPVLGIDCDNGKMNDNLRKALNATVHADIRFELREARFVGPEIVGFLGVDARGDLTIAGATRPLDLTVTGSDTGDGALRVMGRTQILMTDFGIEPPSAILGMLKTKNEVVVLFDLVFAYEDLERRISGQGGS